MKSNLLITTLLVMIFVQGCSSSDSSSRRSVTQHTNAGYFLNPLLQTGADPYVLSKDGWYYYMNTMGEEIGLWKTRNITDLKNAQNKIIWTPPSSGMWSNNLWAPEINFIRGKWYVYFSASDNDDANLRLYVIENASPDPFEGEWTFKGQITPYTNRWAIDGSVFEQNGALYIIWSGFEGDEDNKSQNIYIARMKNPWTVEGDRALISTPEYAWETVGASKEEPMVNEGPIMLRGKDKLFITYSASGCWTDDYCLGMLTAAADADLLDPKSWTKSPKPVFEKSVSDSVFAPGHNGFFRTTDGKEDWLIYHANDKTGQGCGGSRKPRIQRIIWSEDGTPDFGKPVSTKIQLKKPSGE